jgi:type IV pilus assembly protein PilA
MKERLEKMAIRKRLKRGFTLIELMIVVAIIGILAVLAIYGVSRYLKSAKTAEASNNLGAIQKNATEALTREKMLGTSNPQPGDVSNFAYGFCPGEAALVPPAVPAGAKFTTGVTDWQLGKATNAGFFCLKFSVDQPQYYSYGYTVQGIGTGNGDQVTAAAYGDLDGNGTTSSFVLIGQVSNGAIAWSPKPLETNPEE